MIAVRKVMDSFSTPSALIQYSRLTKSCARGVQVVRNQVVEVAQETARFPRWDIIFDQLNENTVKSVKATEARDLMDKGYVSKSPTSNAFPSGLLCSAHGLMQRPSLSAPRRTAWCPS